MPKFTFKVDASAIPKLRRELQRISRTAIDRRTAAQVGTKTVVEMRRDIAKGISPVRGRRRFPAYKNPKKYPGKRKGARPVNLKLTGQFLRALRSVVLSSRGPSGFVTSIGYRGRLAQVKEQGHREGANQQRKRPTIPQRGEELNVRINRELLKIYRKRLSRLISKL